MAILLLALLLPVLFIGIGYYWDYRHDEVNFKTTLKSIALRGVKYIALAAAVAYGGKVVYQLFPLDQNYGIAYNAERGKAGVPLIEPGWALSNFNGDRYEEWWSDSQDTDRRAHTLKIIRYNLIGPTQELDYFGKPDVTFRLESSFDHKSKKCSYRKIESPTANSFSYLYSVPMPNEIITPISKEEFLGILYKWQSK